MTWRDVETRDLDALLYWERGFAALSRLQTRALEAIRARGLDDLTGVGPGRKGAQALRRRRRRTRSGKER